FRSEQPPYSIMARAIEASVLPTCRRYGMGVLVWSPLAWGFLTGKYRLHQPIDLASGRPVHNPARFDPTIPENVTKLAVVEQLIEVADDIDATLPQLAVAFTVAHPAVTSTIIGPRTIQQLEGLLSGASLALDDATLDRIDQIVPPGTNLYHPDAAWAPPALGHSSLRRRPLADRAAP